MFQFPGFSPINWYYVFNIAGCPIRTSTDQRLFAPPRSFSQLITSFVVSESLGIHHTLLFTSYPFALMNFLMILFNYYFLYFYFSFFYFSNLVNELFDCPIYILL